MAEVPPPAGDRLHRELGDIGIDPDRDIPLVELEVIDAVEVDLAQLLVLEVLGAHQHRLALGAPLTAGVAEVADQLLLLGVRPRSSAGLRPARPRPWR
jgi:hypothetical protein